MTHCQVVVHTHTHTHMCVYITTLTRIERENVIYKNDRHFYFATCHIAGPCRCPSQSILSGRPPLPPPLPLSTAYAEWNAVKNGGCVTSHASWVCHTYHTRLNYNRAAGTVAQKQRQSSPPFCPRHPLLLCIFSCVWDLRNWLCKCRLSLTL